MARRRKKKHEEHENLERWLVSYADFLTLLFAFFVVMYAVSSINEGKYRVLSASLVAAFRSSPRSMQPIQIGNPSRGTAVGENQVKLPDTPIKARIPGYPVPLRHLHANENTFGKRPPRPLAVVDSSAQPIQLMAARIERALSELIDKKLVVIRRNPLWLEVQINTSVLFASGSADMAPAAAAIIDRVAGILAPFPNRINVQGFTDDVPIHTAVYPTNWELSAARATRVARQMIAEGVDPARVAATGYGEYHPVADNATDEGRRQNRRVALVILAAYSEGNEPPPYDKPTPAGPPATSQAVASVP